MSAPLFDLSRSGYASLAAMLFPEVPPVNSTNLRGIRGQKFVPFLGAGASLPSPVDDLNNTAASGFPDHATVEAALRILGYPSPDPNAALDRQNKRERMIVKFALALGYLMVSRSRQINTNTVDLRQQLLDGDYPPSATQLAEFFARLTGNWSLQRAVNALMENWPKDWDAHQQEAERNEWVADLEDEFKLLVDAARLWNLNDGLASITARYQVRQGRETLWTDLAAIFGNKKSPTPAHKLTAAMAVHHLEMARQQLHTARTNNEDVSQLLTEIPYLIVTTNYDCLIERALGDECPWVVLYVKRPDGKTLENVVTAKFSPYFHSQAAYLGRQHAGREARSFSLELAEPAVVIFKIHGGLHADEGIDDDSIVITDFDYEEYLARMGRDAEYLVPSAVSYLMRNRAFLFMGYSLNDWNVRTILTTVMRKRGAGRTARDHAVMREISTSADAYCEEREILIVKAPLDNFAAEILQQRAAVIKTATPAGTAHPAVPVATSQVTP